MTEDKENFQDARKEDGSITSRTRAAAVDSQSGEATAAVPQPHIEEKGQGVTAASGHGDG